ncbi:MAG: O-antigen ligase family protein [Cyclobacteriaceae bacterium]
MANRAAKWASYWVGMEIILRMTGGNIVWEGGKYGAILFLLVGLLSENIIRPWPRRYFVYFSLLIPSLLVVDFPDFGIAREEISFNLSGPLLLTISAVYFYSRKVDGSGLIEIFHSAALPLVSLLVYLFMVTPNLENIAFGTESNFQASGGFGPNQVSTLIGLAIFLIIVGLYYKSYVIKSLSIDVIFLIFFAVRGFATFSRGGMLGPLIAGIVLVGYSAIASRRSTILVSVFSFLLLVGTIGSLVWNFVNDKTEGRLKYRYEGRNYLTGKEKDITTGRKEIMLSELNYFYQYPILGIGPGMGTLLVTNSAGNFAHSHSEYTRLLSEHGILGLIALVLLVVSPLIYIFKLPLEHRPLPTAIFVFVLFILAHSAMRLAVPGFFYGLCLIKPWVISKKKKNGGRN